jgi:hypothetical protein
LLPISVSFDLHLKGNKDGTVARPKLKTLEEETMKSGTTVERETSTQSDLASRYKTVGILAVAAALPYQSDCKNSAYAPVEQTLDDERFANGSV